MESAHHSPQCAVPPACCPSPAAGVWPGDVPAPWRPRPTEAAAPRGGPRKAPLCRDFPRALAWHTRCNFLDGGREKEGHMKVDDVMTRTVFTVGPTATIE